MIYNEYKPTAIGWLPEIPSQWDIVDTKRYFLFPKEIVGLDFNDYKVLSLSVNGVIIRNMASGAGKHHSDMGTYQIIRPDTIVLCLFDMDVTPRIVGHSDKTGIITSAYVNLAPKENIVSKYYYYYFLLQDFNKYLFSQGTGIRTTLTRSQFGALKIALPSKEEQTAIANFLDFKLAKIDRFIRKKKQLIKLLNEQKSAIINQAVTKGLNTNAKMKPSGIEWLGDIPEHWEVRKLKYICYLQRGHDLPKEKFINGEYPVYGSNGIIGYHNQFTTKSPCITVGRSGSVGKVNFTEKDFWAHNTSLYVKESYGNNWKYLFYLLGSIDIAMVSNGSAVPTLDRRNVHELFVASPIQEEQEKLVEYIENESSKIAITISTIEKEIALVEEYKTALIAEAVTGKIDVRDFEIPTSLEVEPYEELEEELCMVAEDGVEYETKDIE